MDAYDGMSLCGGLVFFAPVALLVRTQAGISETSWRRPWWRESPPVCPPERPAPICTLCTVNRTICPRHAANLGTAGFLLSTAAYALLYRYFGLTGLLSATVLAGAAGDRVPFASSLLTALGIGWRFALCGGLLLLGALGYMLSSRKITG